MGAIDGTAPIFAVMASGATVAKCDFSGMGKWLFAGALVQLLAAAATIFLQLPALHLTILVLVIAVFILYDVQRVGNGPILEILHRYSAAAAQPRAIWLPCWSLERRQSSMSWFMPFWDNYVGQKQRNELHICWIIDLG